MDQELIKKLIDLNKDFYKKVAVYFSQTRSYSWQGWKRLKLSLKHIDSVLDLGCGNGRFYEFATAELGISSYLGIDADEQLLQLARTKYPGATFIKRDLISEADLTELHNHFDLVVLMGFMHHVPSKELRIDLLREAGRCMSEQAHLVVTFWDFLTEAKLKSKIVPWEELGLDPLRLADHDYLLDWKKGVSAYRYCHFYTDEEINSLAEEAGLEIMDSFYADGPGSKSNRYVIFKRKPALG